MTIIVSTISKGVAVLGLCSMTSSWRTSADGIWQQKECHPPDGGYGISYWSRWVRFGFGPSCTAAASQPDGNQLQQRPDDLPDVESRPRPEGGPTARAHQAGAEKPRLFRSLLAGHARYLAI